MSLQSDLLVIGGLTAIVVGGWLVHPALACALAGAAMLAIGIGINKRQS